MTRQKSYVMIIAGIIAFLGISPCIYAHHQWTSLDGPYWANGIDVAYGMSGAGQNWHRYLIGSDGNNKRIFYWSEGGQKWFQAFDPLPAAGKLISYKNSGSGGYAVCSAYNDDIYLTTDGGVRWNGLGYSMENKTFTTVEINTWTPGTEVYVGCDALSQEASVYKGEFSGGNWNWDQVGDTGLESRDVRDLSYTSMGYSFLVAATDEGLYTHDFDYVVGNPDELWVLTAFDGEEVRVVEELDYHAELWAATGGNELQRKLYFSDSDLPPGDNFVEVEVGSPPSSFNKVVNDISAIHLTGNAEYQSVYLATEDGLYLLDVVGTTVGNLTVRQYVDFKEVDGSPFKYDIHVQSVDYYQESPTALTRNILVGTKYNVYLITENRSGDDRIIQNITITDITKGTFLSEVVALSFLDNNGDDKEIFTVSNNGLIKKSDNSVWNFKGLAFEGEGDWTGTDISVDFSDGNVFILASATSNNSGKIMRSMDGGDTWDDVSPEENPEITTVEFDTKELSDLAYAAGKSNSVWRSQNDGERWEQIGEFSNPDFKDLEADPNYSTTPEVHVCGHSEPKTSWFDGFNWHENTRGLEEVSQLNQISKSYNGSYLCAATESGIYRTDMSHYPENIWEPKINGTGELQMISVINIPNDVYGDIFMAATNNAGPQSNEPNIYMSTNGAESWVSIINGDLSLDKPLIYRLAAPIDGKEGYIVGTGKGVYYLDNIIFTGDLNTDTWGPGNIIILGEVEVVDPYETLTIIPPCTVYAEYAMSSSLMILPSKSLLATGVLGDTIFFTTTGTGEDQNYWNGIRIWNTASTVRLEYCAVEYALNGIGTYYTGQPMKFLVDNCRFSHMSPDGAGIALRHSSVLEDLTIKRSKFTKCGSYGIKFSQDDLTSLKSIFIKDNYFEDCDYGIYYAGNADASGERSVNIDSNVFAQSTPYTGNYGIFAEISNPSLDEPIVNIISDSISYFGEGGIRLNFVASNSLIRGNRVKRNKSYGLFISGSSPDVIGTQEYYNSFSFSKTGIYSTYLSGPTVRWTQIKENTNYGVLISSIFESDFGTRSDPGNNSIDIVFQPGTGYRDMKNIGPAPVDAVWNWWGEYPPEDEEIEGDIIYEPALDSDPIPWLAKRNVDNVNIPDIYVLNQNSPNPFNPTTAISLYLAEPGHANLKIYNLQGQLVKTLISDWLNSGHHTVTWDGTNSRAQEVSSGIYFYVLSTNYGRTSKRMTLLR